MAKLRNFYENRVEIANFQFNTSQITGDKLITKYYITQQLIQLPNGKYAWEEIETRMISQKTENFNFQLSPSTPEEIRKIKAQKVPILIVKNYDQLYYSILGKKFINLSLGKHCCVEGSHTCSRLLALPDERGGCAKVRDVGSEKDITKYPFIVKGFQTCNCSDDSNRFIVLECNNCKYPDTCRPNYA